MIERESDGGGWRVTFRAQGAARFLVAGFLGFWLCGWAMGEAFALGALLSGLREWLAPGLELSWLPQKLRMHGTPWPVLVFLSLWLTGWTVGGCFALYQFLRMLVGVDRVRWDHEGLEVVQCAGPFGSRRREAWADVAELLVRPPARIVAQTRKGLWVLTSGGSLEDRRELGAMLVAALREARGTDGEAQASAESAPTGWKEAFGDDGRTALVSDPGPRIAGAFVAGLIAAGLGTAALAVVSHAREAGAWVGATILTLFALALASAAAWLALGRVELRPSHGSLRRVKRFLGREWTTEFAPALLLLQSETDSDGDERWSLVVSGPDGKATLATDLHVPGAARQMGLWLTRRTDVPLEGQPEAGEDARRAG